MTNQEAFDKVWDWFVVQKQPLSYDERAGVCRYRGPNGERCAIGTLIPDELYDPGIEELSASFLLSDSKLDLELDTVLASDLQHAHDRVAKRRAPSVAEELRRVAANHHLTIPEQS